MSFVSSFLILLFLDIGSYGFVFLLWVREKLIERREAKRKKGQRGRQAKKVRVYEIEMPDVIIRAKR